MLPDLFIQRSDGLHDLEGNQDFSKMPPPHEIFLDKLSADQEVLDDVKQQYLQTAFHQINNEEDIVGFDSQISELRRLILTSEKLLISVVGVGGFGKITLAKRVYNHLEIRKIFHNHAWVCVSPDFKEKNLLVQILKQVTEARDEEKLPLEILQQKLRNLLNTQWYLTVLDDVHGPAIREKLQVVFPNSSNGSRVILTIRDPDIATHIDPETPSGLSKLIKW
ncbi:hypothetical protein Pint_30237 [Pistacia integerrima]|uniref:Uncharacterized protein n=1 Tax=Pistacia integerrima TaxID=434235 RepID=A0ACC0X0X0_9ROSI|nr:hypothetical protein Pint_30237 [Pistacia integerrima]